MEINTINVITQGGSYNISLGNGSLERISLLTNLKRKVLILTDDGVPCEYSQKIKEQSKEGYIYVISQGEKSKNIDNFQKIISYMIEKNFTRTDCLVSVGGGVVGDLGGFVSSVFMRGIDFYNVPTTLLSQVDSSIGGKTAIDFQNIKNIIGTFHQPKAVIIDPLTLKTLDKRQLYAGFVEALKMAACFDKEFFEEIESYIDIESNLNNLIYKALLIKKYVVEQDEFEGGLRKVLNFGHTYGHAIESYFSPNFLHGECVGIGMLLVSEGTIKQRIKSLLEKFSLPVEVIVPKEQLIELIKHDKKASGSMVSLVKVKEIGSYIIEKVEIDNL